MTDLRTTTDHASRRTEPRSVVDANATGRDPGSRAARAVWITLGGILAIAALAWGTYSVIGVLAHAEHTERSTFSSDDVSALAVSNESGSVTITATPGDTVTVVAKVSDGWQTTDMSMQVVNGVLELNTDCPAFVSPWCNVDYTVLIPADRPVTVDGSGSVRVRGMSAPIDIDSDDGRLELDDISGDIRVSNDDSSIVGHRLTASRVDAQNTNGRIELSFLEPPQSVSASAENGSIEVVVPDTEVLYRVEMDTGNGSTDNLVRTDPNSDHVIDLSTDNGSITVRPPG